MKKLLAVLLFVLFAGAVPVFAGNDSVIDKDTLKAMLESPDLVLLDVRTGRDWSSSEFKIKGAVRLENSGIDSATSSYAKEKTIVLYCA